MNDHCIIPQVLRDRTHYLCDKMLEISGHDPGEDTRRRPAVTARVFVTQVLLLEGWSEHQIGNVLGWDHSTINHYRKKFRTFMEAPGYAAERKLWNKFKTTI